jgi:hypothetical protein
MTSANVIEYTIYDSTGKAVGDHRQNVLCKTRWHELLKFTPLGSHTIKSWGYDEEEEYWEDEPKNLLTFLQGTRELKGKV